MTRHVWRFHLIAALASYAALVAGCGGGGGGGSGACISICADLVACAESLGTDVATLSGDDAMTSANCASECNSLTCSDKAAFVSCAQGLSCTSISAVQEALGTCSNEGGCGGGGGAGCTSICDSLAACATALSSTVAILSGDSAMTTSNCVTECQGLAATCSAPSTFISCGEAITCTSVSGVQTQVSVCASSGGCGT